MILLVVIVFLSRIITLDNVVAAATIHHNNLNPLFALQADFVRSVTSLKNSLQSINSGTVYQSVLTNASNDAISLLLNDKIKNLTIASGANFYYPNGLINNSNDHLSLSETEDMVTIDVKPAYLNTVSSLSNLFYTKEHSCSACKSGQTIL